jgi:hypothetical protein
MDTEMEVVSDVTDDEWMEHKKLRSEGVKGTRSGHVRGGSSHTFGTFTPLTTLPSCVDLQCLWEAGANDANRAQGSVGRLTPPPPAR